MAYPVKAVANAILRIASEHGSPVSPLKLQKLVYIAHGWNLGLMGKPLIEDELPEAWQYGPVFPSLYQEFKEFGKSPIKGLASSLELSEDRKFQIIEPEIPEEHDATWALLRKVWDSYGKFGGVSLSDLTHKPGTPWDQVYKNSGGIKNADINNDIIKDHYKDLIQKRSGATA